MGLFSRSDGAASRKPAPKPRPSISSEAQAAELRVRARRRLAGAIALVLAAVFVLPMFLDSESNTPNDKITVKIPKPDTPFQPNLAEQSTPSTGAVSGTVSGTPVLPSAETAAAATANPPGVSGATNDTSAVAPPESPVTPPPASKPEVKKPADTKPSPTPSKGKDGKDAKEQKDKVRTDDGSRALALLEGRAVASPSAVDNSAKPPVATRGPTKGNFVIQVVSLSVQSDAYSQRDKLIAQGVSNTYVDGPVDVGGRQYYRVRVGKFESKEAALGAKVRLSTLGFGNVTIIPQ